MGWTSAAAVNTYDSRTLAFSSYCTVLHQGIATSWLPAILARSYYRSSLNQAASHDDHRGQVVIVYPPAAFWKVCSDTLHVQTLFVAKNWDSGDTNYYHAAVLAAEIRL